MSPRLPTRAELVRWGSPMLVIVAGWAAGRGLAVGMDTLHAASAGFALTGSIFLAVAVRDEAETARSTAG